MLKRALLAGAVVMAAPAFAQTATTATQTSPAPMTTAPQSAQTVDPMGATPMQSPQAQTTPETGTPATGAPAQTATAEPAATGDQVAQAVGGEFGTYDKDGNGVLSQSEFGAWMVALKAASDPTTKPEAPATRKWVGAAFAQADKDKSRSISKTELTGFLSQGKS